MAIPLNYNIVLRQTHETEDDCRLIIRTNNGRVFYCHIDLLQFHYSPGVTEQYLKCLMTLRAAMPVRAKHKLTRIKRSEVSAGRGLAVHPRNK